MAIDVLGDGSRYTSTQTQSFRRAPMGELGVAQSYVPSAQVDALDKAWVTLANEGFFKLVNVPKNISDQFNAIWDAYTKWRDTEVDIVNNKASNFAAQQTALQQAKVLYAQAVNAGAKPEVSKGPGKVTVLGPTAVTAGTGIVLVVLGLAFVLLTWHSPEEEKTAALSGIDEKRGRKRRTVHLEFLTGHSFTRFRVQASQKPEWFGHQAEHGWVLPDKKHMDRFNQLLKSWGGNVADYGGGKSLEGLRRRFGGRLSGADTRRYRVTSSDKYHGPNKETYEIELPASAFSSKKALGKALRDARILVSGQTVRDFRGPTKWERGEPLPGRNILTGESRPTQSPYAKNPVHESAVIVFPNNAPGLTTGYHSITLTPVGS